jgi:hypothetical protein
MNNTLDYDAWTVDEGRLTATHDSGFTLQWEGSAKDPSAIHPGRFPKELSSIEQVRLLRLGVEFIAKSQSPVAPKKSAYVAPANKPQRAKLSLKPKASVEA